MQGFRDPFVWRGRAERRLVDAVQWTSARAAAPLFWQQTAGSF